MIGAKISQDMKEQFDREGFLVVPNLVPLEIVKRVREKYQGLFQGNFETGVYPDEWHWREGISRPDAFREIVNGWKSDLAIRGVACASGIGKVASLLMGWDQGARLAQDDCLWKPPLAGEVAFHQDSAYISAQFRPLENNSVTVWIALDPADEETGVVEYCPGSHLWQVKTGMTSTEFHGAQTYDASLYHAAKQAGVTVDKVTKRRVSVSAGSAIFHHQDVWHGSDRNRSDSRHRRALGIHLIRRDVCWRSSPHPDYIYGRYVIPGSTEPEEVFFPTVFDPALEKSSL